MPKKPVSVRSVAVTATKGGVGKTTLTVHLAVAAMIAQERVLVLDADPQRSCILWAGLRDREEPRVEGIESSAVPERIVRAATEGFTCVVVDTAPRASNALASLLRAVNYAIVPLRPSAFDLGTLEQSLSIVGAAKTPGCIVLNACSPRAPEIAETRASVSDLELPLSPIEVCERRVYGRAVASGRAVLELEPNGAAAVEMASLWRFVAKGMTT